MNDALSLYIITPSGPEAAGAAVPGSGSGLQSLNLPRALFGEKKIPQDKLQKSWADTHKMLALMIADAEQDQKSGFQLQEMEVSLSVSGEGNIGFVSAKAEAGITLKFKRN